MAEENSNFTDLTSVFSNIITQDTFSSFEEFDSLFNEFQDQTGSVFRVKSSTSVDTSKTQVWISYVCFGSLGEPKEKRVRVRLKKKKKTFS